MSRIVRSPVLRPLLSFSFLGAPRGIPAHRKSSHRWASSAAFIFPNSLQLDRAHTQRRDKAFLDRCSSHPQAKTLLLDIELNPLLASSHEPRTDVRIAWMPMKPVRELLAQGSRSSISTCHHG